MENTVFIFFVGIVLVMFIGVITSGRRRPNSHLNHDTTNASDFVYFGPDDNQSHHHGHSDHSASLDFSHGDSGSSHFGGCDGGGCDGGGGSSCD